ncbi:hypothetical protein L2E82_28551 [Cichorium intybus]|uniref:Uncharacterized protein n=1 Tax=Cichorium intybus TaxID=13427 RepID=A0ACB9CW27_CICIN|nr:hypothetical protein L2E82_28551 [Cichorium intybus]
MRSRRSRKINLGATQGSEKIAFRGATQGSVGSGCIRYRRKPGGRRTRRQSISEEQHRVREAERRCRFVKQRRFHLRNNMLQSLQLSYNTTMVMPIGFAGLGNPDIEGTDQVFTLKWLMTVEPVDRWSTVNLHQ